MKGEAGLTLAGLAGENPLAVLAAFGTLRVLGLAWPDRGVRLAWRPAEAWRPVLSVDGGCSREEVVAELDRRLRGRDRSPEFAMVQPGGPPRELTMTTEEFAEVARRAARCATQSDRAWADFCAAYGTDAVPGDKLPATSLRFTAGQQDFLGSIRQLASESPPPPAGKRRARRDLGAATTAEHLDRALFDRWTYRDPKPSLRWDPVDDRRHAHRAEEPGGSPIQTVRGANRLAVEALPWLPTFGQDGRAVTRGFQDQGHGLAWTWPIWRPPLSGPTVASLLGLADLAREAPPRESLLARGVVEVYRARRYGDYYRNFAPGVACWGRGISFNEVVTRQ